VVKNLVYFSVRTWKVQSDLKNWLDDALCASWGKNLSLVRYLGPPKKWFRSPALLAGWNCHFLQNSYLNFSFLAISTSYLLGTLTKFTLVWVHVWNTGLDKTDWIFGVMVSKMSSAQTIWLLYTQITYHMKWDKCCYFPNVTIIFCHSWPLVSMGSKVKFSSS